MLKLFLKRLFTPHSPHDLEGAYAPLYFFSIVVGSFITLASIVLWDVNDIILRVISLAFTIWLIINYIHNKDLK